MRIRAYARSSAYCCPSSPEVSSPVLGEDHGLPSCPALALTTAKDELTDVDLFGMTQLNGTDYSTTKILVLMGGPLPGTSPLGPLTLLWVPTYPGLPSR